MTLEGTVWSGGSTVHVGCLQPTCAGRVPGHPHWQLAPRGMAWEGRTLGEICAQIKDPARNGGRSLEELVHHIGSDTLVGWAWAPDTAAGPHPARRRRPARSRRHG